MKLNYITFMVRDIEKSVEFYQKMTELNILKRFEIPMGEIAFVSNGEEETMIELIQFDIAEKVNTKGMIVSFKASENLELLRERAIELGFEPSEILEKAPKPAHFIVNDPDGIVIEFSV